MKNNTKTNYEGLTLVEWLNAAGYGELVEAWAEGGDPSDYRNYTQLVEVDPVSVDICPPFLSFLDSK